MFSLYIVSATFTPYLEIFYLRTIVDLVIGEGAIIDSLQDSRLSIKLLEMGFVPKSFISVLFKAPFGGPIGISVNGTIIGLRREEAILIYVNE